ncbi:gephyrin-like molybdotransferase Glp [Agromyces aurantiacus]|uniref:Molybdopterin molybdenumtransferase n=1 Tax=Agromyces aurantiacus TaxID=165814 RepID=A0ABV9R5V5_9MICO|nr:gephyrin-like molybdotransferase Glp [Agromyces aurantiacus]MBM7506061.1 molybdopterin molybdotransferase [Agromyces aurantiacus]
MPTFPPASAGVAAVSVDAHFERVLAGVAPIGRVDAVRLADAAGRTLATAVDARVDVPAFDNSAMDGYAVRRADVASASPDAPVVLDVVADLPAGSAEDRLIEPGRAARIMTGAPIPPGADAVVAVERTDGGSDRVAILAAARPAHHVRRRGEDVRAGERVLEPGVLLDAARVAAAAAAGLAELAVAAPPRVAVVATGSELVEPGAPLGRGRIHDSNSLLLAALVADAGGVVSEALRVPDDPGLLLEWIEAREPCDLVVFAGGVSVGAHDVVRHVLGGLGGVGFSRVAMQPGAPQAFGALPGGTPVFGLPGNPVSVAVSFEAFVRPALRRMLGHADVRRATWRATVDDGWRSPPGRRQYMPVALAVRDGRPVVRRATRGGAGSHLVAGLASADGFAIVPEEVEDVAAGDAVEVAITR